MALAWIQQRCEACGKFLEKYRVHFCQDCTVKITKEHEKIYNRDYMRNYYHTPQGHKSVSEAQRRYYIRKTTP